MDKREVRKMIRSRKAAHTQDELAVMSSDITARLLAHARVRAARVILVYYSLPDEVGTHGLVDRLVEMGKTVLLPRVRDEHTMTLHRYTAADDLQESALHIWEPSGPEYTDYDSIEVAVVPGMAFSSDGYRLGRGRGYYDRMLPLLRNAYKIGVGFGFQIVSEVPTDKYDVPMAEVIAGR